MKRFIEFDYSENFRQVLALIFQKRRITRKQLAEITGLSNLTIAKIVKALLLDGTVIETTPDNSDKGRKPLLLSVNPEYGYIIGIDMGAFATKIGVVDFGGSLIKKEFVHRIDPHSMPANIMDFEGIQNKIEALIGEYGSDRIRGIGIGISGLVDYENQTIVFCPNIHGYNNLPISALLEKRFGIPVQVDTSARCMALGERYFGAREYAGNLSFVTVGHSIAVGTLMGSTTFRGSNGFAGELGHAKALVSNQNLCTCGSSGCIECYATTPLVRSRVMERLAEFRGYSLLKEKFESTHDISFDDISAAAQAGDKVAMSVLGETVITLGTILADYINLFNPTVLVLGGGFFDLYPFTVTDFERVILEKSLTPSQQHLQIYRSELSADGAIIGSAMQLIQQLFL